MLTIKEARKVAKTFGVNSLLAEPLGNPKVAKNGKLGVLTAPMHLAPFNLSGFQVCPKATAGCAAACLHTAGNPAYMAGKAHARAARTKMYFKAREAFLVLLKREIELHIRAAERQSMEPAVRLNATSDIPWESVRLDGKSMMEHFPSVQFYDYTKRPNRKGVPSNYHLTFSLAETNERDAILALGNGFNVAAVFNVARLKSLPQAYTLAGTTITVIDGDEHDYRPADRQGVIVGLRAKGRAIGDKSGFVRVV